MFWARFKPGTSRVRLRSITAMAGLPRYISNLHSFTTRRISTAVPEPEQVNAFCRFSVVKQAPDDTCNEQYRAYHCPDKQVRIIKTNT